MKKGVKYAEVTLLSPYDKGTTAFQTNPKVESPHTAVLHLALGKGDLMQKEELEHTKNWLVADEKGVKYAEVTLFPYDKGTTVFQTNPKVESPHTDVLHLALGKGDLMQKEELEHTKNWLVGDEKGVKYAEVTLFPYDKGTTVFQTNPKVESPHTDVLHFALGKGDLMQKEELEHTKNWLVGDEKGVKYAEVALLSPYDKGTTAFQTNPKVESPTH